MIKKRYQIKEDNSRKYHENYINEVYLFLREHGLSKRDADSLINKFKIMVKQDPLYVFHYNSQYWADYILEASGMDKRLVSV